MATSSKSRSTRQAAALPPESAPPMAGEEPDTPACMGRQDLIAQAAFFLAEARGFAPGREMEDWLLAEGAVARQLGTELH